MGDIWVLRLEDRKLLPFATTKYFENQPEFSPDGRWLSYDSEESGRREVYARSFPDGAVKKKISKAGGAAATWDRTGHRLFYVELPSRNLVAIDVRLQPTLEVVGPPRRVSDMAVAPGSPLPNYCTLDGRHFLMVRDEASKPQPVTHR